MPKYVALIRGIGPTNPNMKGAKLASVFESLGCTSVQPFLSSGNVLFASDITDVAQLESQAEIALSEQLGFTRTTIIRSHAELQKLVSANPFPGLVQGQKHYITITFLKNSPVTLPELPYRPDSKGYEVMAMYDRAIAATLDQTHEKTPNLMGWLEKQYGKQITTRTWNTVTRVVARLDKM